MILSDGDIKQAIKEGHLGIDPPPQEDQYNTSAVDLLIGSDFRCWDHKTLNTRGFDAVLNLSDQKFADTATAFLKRMEPEKDGSFKLKPFSENPIHIIAVTRERISLNLASKLAARVEGRSSLARLGLAVHLTAPTIHAGWDGQIALEMINFGPFTLQFIPDKTRLCQIIFERLQSDPTGGIKTSFQGQTKPSGEH